MKTAIRIVLAFAFSAPAFGAITMCDKGGGLTVSAAHGDPSAHFGLLLDPILHIEAHLPSVTLSGSEVVIDQQIGPEAGPLFPPECALLRARGNFAFWIGAGELHRPLDREADGVLQHRSV